MSRHLSLSAQASISEGIEACEFVTSRSLADVAREVDALLPGDASEETWECEDHGSHCWIRMGDTQVHVYQDGRVKRA
jgi:hypothetical protein